MGAWPVAQGLYARTCSLTSSVPSCRVQSRNVGWARTWQLGFFSYCRFILAASWDLPTREGHL
jgi:hypothetical protein